MIATAHVIRSQDLFRPTDDQARALELLEPFAVGDRSERMALLEGYAGTGKTTLVGELIHRCAKRGVVVALAAPTNKAVRVLREKVQADDVDFASIHSLLGLRMIERDDGGTDCRAEGEPKLERYELVIVDECSMVSPELFRQVMLYGQRTRVLFVGDPCQLPPVGSQDRSPVFDHVKLRARLASVVRQAEASPIIRLSMRIREGIDRNEPISPEQIAEALPAAAPGAEAVLVAGDEATTQGFVQYEAEQGRDARVIAFKNSTVIRHNAAVHRLLHGFGAPGYVPGQTVMLQTPFEYPMPDRPFPGRLHTSEECKVLKVVDGEHPQYPEVQAVRLTLQRDTGEVLEAWAPTDQAALDRIIGFAFSKAGALKRDRDSAGRPEERRAIDVERNERLAYAFGIKQGFIHLRHCYALTAHKSQGSTFDTAIIDLRDLARMRTAFDYNRALYVAVTRPRKYLAVVV